MELVKSNLPEGAVLLPNYMNLCSQCGIGNVLEDHAKDIVEDLGLDFDNFKAKIDKLDGLNWYDLCGFADASPIYFITSALEAVSETIENSLTKYPNNPDEQGWLSYMAKGILNIRHVYLYNTAPMEGITLRYGNNTGCGSEYEDHPTQIPNSHGRLIYEHRLGGYA